MASALNLELHPSPCIQCFSEYKHLDNNGASTWPYFLQIFFLLFAFLLELMLPVVFNLGQLFSL